MKMSVYTNFKFPNSSAEALDRVVDAYGFTMKMQLADHLGIAASSLSARYKRDVFPSDIVLQCVMETGADLQWLIMGKGSKFSESKPDTPTLIRKKLISGKIEDAGYVMLDKALYAPLKQEPRNAFLLLAETTQYIIDTDFEDMHDGVWLVEIEGTASVRTLTRIPVRKVHVSGIGVAFDCGIDDIKLIGRVVLTIQ